MILFPPMPPLTGTLMSDHTRTFRGQTVYTPPAFQVQDPQKLAAFMSQHSFATLVSTVEGRPFATHLPLLYDPQGGPSGRLLGHMARANSQWSSMTQQQVLAIFQGPHAYISPRAYLTKVAVPTWNYAVVHAYGTPQLVTDADAFAAIIERTIARYEGTSPEAWQDQLPAETRGKLMQAIVGFEIPITHLEGKFKLGQNRSREDIAGVYNALSQSTEPQDRALADFMKSEGLA